MLLQQSHVSARAVLALLVAVAPMAAHARPGADAWRERAAWFARDRLWDDGKAEIARYQAARTIYGASRPHVAHLITVKEDFDEVQGVKADAAGPAKRIREVLKQNAVSDVPTEFYTYHLMTTLMVNRSNLLEPLKLAVSTQEWCGTTFKEFVGDRTDAHLAFHSYWDGEGDGSHPLELAGGQLMEDQLLLAVRSFPPEAGAECPVSVYESFVSNRSPPPSLKRGRMRTMGPQIVLGAKGQAITSVRVLLAIPGREANYWIAAEYPHVVVKYDGGDGRTLLLEDVTRRAYWPPRRP